MGSYLWAVLFLFGAFAQKCLRDSSMLFCVAVACSVVQCSIVCIHPTVFVQATANGHWVIANFVAITNRAAVNILLLSRFSHV